MVDPLNAWWAQQLVLCDWAFTPPPTVVDAEAAEQRLVELKVASRGTLAGQLLDSLSPQANAETLLSALELTALAGAAGWLSEPRAKAWVWQLVLRITREYSGLEHWLKALRRARNARGWLEGDDGFIQTCEALETLEREGEGVTWERLIEWLAHAGNAPTLWPDTPDQQSWRACALLRPVVVYPAGDRDWPEACEWLKQVWQLQSRDELVTALLWLGAQGDRQRWDIEADMLVALDESQRSAWRESMPSQEPHSPILYGFVTQGEPLEWAAWDWLRLVELAWAGACCGWLTQQEADAFAAHAVDLLGRRYHDWHAVLNAFQRGQSLFEGKDLRHKAALRHDVLLKNPLSPWHLPLIELLDTTTREASQEAMRAWRRDPDHWLLALAGVREPDLMLRQANPRAPVPEARRADAAEYLQETLGLHAEEGARSLARYWLPAQAHHLNQLAADAAHGALPASHTLFGDPMPDDLRQRNALKGVSRHAATIHMAEKFAFYLHMSMDSGLFEAAELDQFSTSLRSCLCRFYPDARRLLEAWLAWEICLPELDEASLIQELQWHLQDPGSIFHWLDWHPGDWQEPGARPSLSHFTAMALVGPLNTAVWSEPQPESERECQAIREWVDGHYGLNGATEMKEFLAFMLESGDRQEYQINYAPYTLNPERLEAEIAIMESGDCLDEERHHLLRLCRIRDNEDQCNDVDMAAWDVAQLVDLTIAGRQLGWLSATEFAAQLEKAYALAANHYAGWEDYARGMYAGFSFFMGETPERESFLAGFRQALIAWLSGAPPLAGAWTSLDFPGAKPRHFAPLHIDTLPGDFRTLH
ncbi:DUF1266 domain-containing protein [Halomonas sediminis]